MWNFGTWRKNNMKRVGRHGRLGRQSCECVFINTIYALCIYSIIIFMCWSHEMRCINLARLLFDNIFLFFFPFLFLHFCCSFHSSSYFLCLLLGFLWAHSLLRLHSRYCKPCRRCTGAGGCWGGVGRGVVSAANLLRLLLTVAMFEGHAGSAKLAKKNKEIDRKYSWCMLGKCIRIHIRECRCEYCECGECLPLSVCQPFVSTINSNGTELSVALRLRRRRRQLPEDDDRPLPPSTLEKVNRNVMEEEWDREKRRLTASTPFCQCGLCGLSSQNGTARAGC